MGSKIICIWCPEDCAAHAYMDYGLWFNWLLHSHHFTIIVAYPSIGFLWFAIRKTICQWSSITLNMIRDSFAKKKNHGNMPWSSTLQRTLNEQWSYIFFVINRITNFVLYPAINQESPSIIPIASHIDRPTEQ